MAGEEDSSPPRAPAYFSDFIIDFLGSLAPGVVFLSGFWFSVIVPFSEGLKVVDTKPGGERLPLVLLAGIDVGSGGATIVALGFLMVAFVIGTIFVTGQVAATELAVDLSGLRRLCPIQESDDSRIAERSIQGSTH